MAASIMQSAVATGTSTALVATLGATPTLGNTLVVITNSNNIVTLNASAGTGWTQRAAYLGDQDFHAWTRPVVSSDITAFTINSSPADDIAIVVLELAGVLATPFDVAGTVVAASGVAASQIASTITTTAANDLVLVIHAVHGIESSYTGAVSYNNSFTAAVAANPATGFSTSKTALLIGQKTQATAGAVGATTITTTGSSQNRASVMLAFKPSTGGTTYTATPADAVGVADAVSVSGIRSLTFTDSVGITDLGANQTIDYGTTSSDAVDLTDTALRAFVGARAATDPTAVTDTATTALLAARTATDTAAITDSAAVTLFSGYTATPADNAAITDTVTTAADAQRSAADTLGLTDSTNILITTAGSINYNDPVNITDGTATALSGARTAGDSINVTDTATAVLTIAGGVIAGDQAGVTDAINIVMSRIITVADFLALTDNSTATNPSNQHYITVTATLAPQRWHATLPENTRTATLTDRRYGAYLA